MSGMQQNRNWLLLQGRNAGAVAPEADVAAVQVVLRNPGIAVVDVTEFCFSKVNLSPWTIAA